MSRNKLDARARRTREALHRAMASLIQLGRYDEVGVAAIAARAGVSRSTFYAHFAGKDALLASSIAGPFALLADTLTPGCSDVKLASLLQHFWDQRVTARGILTGSARRKSIRVLIRLVEERLRHAGLHRRGALILPMRLAAVQLSESLLAPVTAWLLGESRCTTAVLAAALRRTSQASLAAMIR